MSDTGKLYLIPTTLGDNEPLEVLPLSVKKTIEHFEMFRAGCKTMSCRRRGKVKALIVH